MITRPSVLVLGAGASMDFGFPSGWGLYQRVIYSLSNGPDVARAMHDMGVTPSDCAVLLTALQRSGAKSVDAFLAYRRELVEVGKAAIAAALIPCENALVVLNDSIMEPGRAPAASWLRWLFERMKARDAEEWRRNQLSIVTFNYDRVVEFFLHSALVHNFSLTEVEAWALLSNTVKIVHVHGLLGEFPGGRPNVGRPFEPNLGPATLRMAASGVLIAHEGSEDDEQFTAARSLLDNAERVMFMGFGFNPDNISRLRLESTLRGKTVRSSCIGMVQTELAVVQDLVPETGFGFDPSCASLTDLIRHHAILT